jgi:hypothetical protein
MRTLRACFLRSLVIAVIAALTPAIRSADLDLSDPAQVARLQSDLASPQFAVRDAAQKSLAAVPRERIEDLRHLAATAADPDAKARLAARVDELQELLETDPPPIAFHVQNADLAGLAAAFTKVSGRPFEVVVVQGLRVQPGVYTLQTDARPFWQIYSQLARQNLFTFLTSNNAIGVGRVVTSWDQLQFHRGFALFLRNPRPIGGTPAQYLLDLNLGFDPRIRVATLDAPHIDRLTDEHARAWPPGTPIAGGMIGTTILMNASLMLKTPDDAGQVLSLAGTWPVQIAEEWKSIEIADFTKPPATPLVFGNNEFTITQLDLADKAPAGQTLKLNLTRTVFNGAPVLPDPRAMIRNSIVYKDPHLELTLLDADGKVLLVHSMGGDETLGANETVPGKVAKMVLTYPVKLRQYRVPFEFKDIPVKP